MPRLLDNQPIATLVLANLKQVLPSVKMSVHPMPAAQVDGKLIEAIRSGGREGTVRLTARLRTIDERAYRYVARLPAPCLLIRPQETEPFEAGVFRVIIPWLGGAEDDEGEQVFRGAEGVHSEAGG